MLRKGAGIEIVMYPVEEVSTLNDEVVPDGV
jgi:hypothetical protein